MSPRNIRAHQARGLLSPPLLRGRVGYYDAHHLARLHLIAALQAEGFNLAAIQRLVERTDTYAGLVADRRGAVRGDSAAVVVPLGPQAVAVIEAVSPDLLERFEAVGLLWREGETWATTSLLAGSGSSLTLRGVPVELVLRTQLEAAVTGERLGRVFAAMLTTGTSQEDRREVLALASRMFAAGFEEAFARAAGLPRTSAPPPAGGDPPAG